jgi:serine/threonine protein kinase
MISIELGSLRIDTIMILVHTKCVHIKLVVIQERTDHQKNTIMNHKPKRYEELPLLKLLIMMWNMVLEQNANHRFLLNVVQVDVYSLGNIFYMLLQGDWPFYDVPQEMATELVKNGTRPSVYTDLWLSTDPVDVALKEVMIMCHEQNATERASARVVEQYLINAMRQLDYQQ